MYLIQSIVLNRVDIDKVRSSATLAVMPPSATANMSARQDLGMVTSRVFIIFQKAFIFSLRRSCDLISMLLAAARTIVTRRTTAEKKRQPSETTASARGHRSGDATSVSRPGGLYWMVNTGGLALSRVSNRFAVAISDSSPSTSQPKLVAGSFKPRLHVGNPSVPNSTLYIPTRQPTGLRSPWLKSRRLR